MPSAPGKPLKLSENPRFIHMPYKCFKSYFVKFNHFNRRAWLTLLLVVGGLFTAPPEGHAVQSVDPSNAKSFNVKAKTGEANKPGMEQLRSAIQSDDVEKVKALLAAGADVNGRYDDESTVLSDAVDNGNVEMVKTLLAAGANVNEKTAGRTALMSAVDNLDRETDEKDFIIMEKIKALLAAGADVNARDESGNSALISASAAEQIIAVNALLAAGANIEDGERSELLQTYPGSSSALFVALMGAGESSYKDENKVKNADAVARALLAAGANPHQYSSRHTPLMAASASGNPEVVKTLLAAGTEVNAKNAAGQTALMFAGTFFPGGCVDDPILVSTESVQSLLDAGAIINTSDFDGFTPLMILAQSPSVGALEILLNNGADPNAASKEGDTALTLAVQAGRIDIISRLIATGANLNAKNIQGDTALQIAKQAARGKINFKSKPDGFIFKSINDDPPPRHVYEDIVELLQANGGR